MGARASAKSRPTSSAITLAGGDKRERKDAKGVRGIIVASDFDQRVMLAASQLPDLALVRYGVKFEFETRPKDL